MVTALIGVNISPVNMDDRKNLGLKPGDTVRVHQKIVDEKGKTRIQMFEGLVLARKHGNEPGATFTVRRVTSGIGVEKIFPLYSPSIDKIEIVKRAKVRRAKLYYIREKVNREIKRQMRRMQMMDLATESEAETAIRVEAEATKKVEEDTKAADLSAEASAKEEEAVKKAEGAEAAGAEKTENTKDETVAGVAGDNTPDQAVGESEEKESTEKSDETKKEDNK